MKNRRIILISFLLVTTLCVGIGYAAVQQTLTVTGDGSVGAEQAEEAPEPAVAADRLPAPDQQEDRQGQREEEPLEHIPDQTYHYICKHESFCC